MTSLISASSQLVAQSSVDSLLRASSVEVASVVAMETDSPDLVLAIASYVIWFGWLVGWCWLEGLNLRGGFSDGS